MSFSDIIRKNWLTLVLAFVPFLILAFVWDKVPDQVPLHWNIKGEIDNYGSRYTLCLFPLFTLGIVAILWAVPFIDPKKTGEYFSQTIGTFGLVLAAFMLYIFILILVSAMGIKTDVGSWVIFGVLILLMIIGNYFGKLRPNYFIGIRTPWTLEKESVWIKTHRFAGILWVGGSLVMVVLKLLVADTIFVFVFIPFIVMISLVPLIYSYIVYRNEQ